MRYWLLVATLVAAAHAGIWYGLSTLQQDHVPSRLPSVIDASLLPPPSVPQTEPSPPVPPPPEPPPVKRPKTPPQRPRVAPIEQPTPAPAVATVKSAESSAQLPAPAPLAQEAPPAPATPSTVPPPEARTAEPPIEVPRFNAAYLNNPAPAYPAVARRRGIEGQVVVRAEVQADGTCTRVELKQTSGHALLDQTALSAVKKWRFIPARKGSQAIAAWVDVPITFKLEN